MPMITLPDPLQILLKRLAGCRDYLGLLAHDLKVAMNFNLVTELTLCFTHFYYLRSNYKLISLFKITYGF